VSIIWSSPVLGRPHLDSQTPARPGSHRCTVIGFTALPAWVARATAEDPQCPIDDPIRRRIALFDGHGRPISPEGHPADIRHINGTRVLVAHPPHNNEGWLTGRIYILMRPTLTLDHIMTLDEAATWYTRISPARVHPHHGGQPI